MPEPAVARRVQSAVAVPRAPGAVAGEEAAARFEGDAQALRDLAQFVAVAGARVGAVAAVAAEELRQQPHGLCHRLGVAAAIGGFCAAGRLHLRVGLGGCRPGDRAVVAARYDPHHVALAVRDAVLAGRRQRAGGASRVLLGLISITCTEHIRQTATGVQRAPGGTGRESAPGLVLAEDHFRRVVDRRGCDCAGEPSGKRIGLPRKSNCGTAIGTKPLTPSTTTSTFTSSSAASRPFDANRPLVLILTERDGFFALGPAAGGGIAILLRLHG